MSERSEWAERPNVVSSEQPSPLLAGELGLDREDVAELLFGDFEFDGDPVILAALSWDISGDAGWSSPAGGESGQVYLAAYDSQYWTVVFCEGELDVESVTTVSDDEAIERFLLGFVNGNDAVTVYRRRGERRPDND